MLTYPLEKRGKMPLYQYLYQCIRDDIIAGNLAKGSKLPSKRELAQNLNVSVITVQNAYEELQIEGYITSMERRGFYVLRDESGIPVIPHRTGTALAITEQTPDQQTAVGKKTPPPADLTGKNCLPQDFPYTSWARTMRAVLKDNPPELLEAPPSKGLRPLRAAIAKHLWAYRGIQTAPERIVVGSGAEHLYGMIVTLLGRNLLYATEDPGYQKFRKLINNQGADVVAVPIDHDGLRCDQLKASGADVVHLSPAHHFPTGTVMTLGRRRELLQWGHADTANRWFIEDDYDCELRLRGRPVSTLYALNQGHQVIYMNTFSCTLSPAMRIAYLVLPDELIETYERTCGYYTCTVPVLEQLTLARFIEQGDFGRHINRARTAGRNRRSSLLHTIRQSELSKIATIDEKDAGLHFLLRLHGTYDQTARDQLRCAIAARGIAIKFLDDYRHNANRSPGEPLTIVMNYSNLAPKDYKETITKLADAIHSINL
ncbi:MAG TPA: PLP-dependent aminotransferase family protein [Clostridiaceae bacterium]|nr:PLP-dependent aminotransferase family protein [Clostridiaceae bacterium]